MSRIGSTATAGVALVAAAVVVATTVLGGGADDDPGGSTALPSILAAPDGSVLAAGLVAPRSCADLGVAMEELAAEHADDGFVDGGVAFSEEEMADNTGGDDSAVDASAASARGTDGATGTDLDGTNVQEVGVDEPDVVERVGDVTIVGTQGILRVVTIDGRGAPVARGELPVGLWGELELLAVSDARVVAIVRDGLQRPLRGVTEGDERATIVPNWSSTTVALIDVGDPDEPRELSRIDLEGWLVDARAVDGVVRIAVRGDGPQVDVSGPMERLEREMQLEWDDASDDEIQAYQQRYDEQYAALTSEARAEIEPTDWQPHARVTGADGTSELVPLVDCDRIGFPTSYAGLGTLTLAAIDATGTELAIDDATSVVTAGEQLYSDADRVVIATTRWLPCCEQVPLEEEPPAPDEDPFFDDGDDGAVDAGSEDAAAIATSSAMIDIGRPIGPGWWGRGNTTDLHVFDVDGTVVSHVASGSVDGWLLNQFAMSIHDDVLRVATTVADDDTGRTESGITTFRVEGTDLVELGAVGGLGADEEIQAVRFMGDVGYVVTFRRTDPLYVVDLADPTEPRTLGELKIEGYSAYLHPLGPGRLLGVGQDADPATGMVRGVQVSTFDVTDPTAPTRLDVDVTPNGHSEVEWDHHALTVTGEGTVLVPFEQYGSGTVEDDDLGPDEQRIGVLAYSFDDDGSLTRIGVMDVGNRWELRPRRTVDLGEVLLTVGDLGVVSWDATTFEPLGTITFPEPDDEAMQRELDQG